MKKIFKILTIIIIFLGITSCGKVNNDKNKENNSERNIIYSCKNKIGENNDYKMYLLLEIEVKNDIALKSSPKYILKYDDKSIYESMKNNENFKKDKEFNDNDLTIKYSAGADSDLTHNPNGESQTFNIDEYLETLKSTGYECTK